MANREAVDSLQTLVNEEGADLKAVRAGFPKMERLVMKAMSFEVAAGEDGVL